MIIDLYEVSDVDLFDIGLEGTLLLVLSIEIIRDNRLGYRVHLAGYQKSISTK